MCKSNVIFLSMAIIVFSSLSSKANSMELSENLDKSQMIMVGEAQFSMLFWDIYNSKLYTPSGKFEELMSGTLFEIKYQRNISKVELIERTIEQWQHLNIGADMYQVYLPMLDELWPDITKGDTLALLVGKQSSYFYFNGIYLGTVDGEFFAELFLSIWLSPKTSQPKLRQQLIGAD